MRIVIADDAMLVREGLGLLLAEAGFEVVGKASDAAGLLHLVEARRPDAAIVDISMPPSHTDEGLVAADTIRAEHPQIGVLVLSQHLRQSYAMRLLERHPAGVGYLLKERVSDMAVLADALHRLADGESVIDPTIVARLLGEQQRAGPIADLTERELEVLGLIAEGRSNRAICRALFLSPRTVESHVRQIFLKLKLADAQDDHRRVLAVLAYLSSPASQWWH
jgi:DNA-binding NarL/FixJ family response regulator